MSNYPQVFNFSYNEDVRVSSLLKLEVLSFCYTSAGHLALPRYEWGACPCRRTASIWWTASQRSASRACGASSPTGVLRQLQRPRVHMPVFAQHPRLCCTVGQCCKETAHKPVRQLCRFHQQRRDQQQREEMTKHQDRQPRKQQQKRPQFFHRNDQRVRPFCSPTHPCILQCP